MHARTIIGVILIIPSLVLCSPAKNGYMEVREPKKDIVTIPEVTQAPEPDADELPTCLLCVCLIGSVYCEEVSPEISSVPALPRETAYLYARYNKIKKIKNKDFANMDTLKRINLSGNIISEIEDGAFSKLPNLEELNLSDNKLIKLPMLPSKLTTLNANFNLLKSKGVKSNAFKKLLQLSYLYLGNNELEVIPHLPESLQVVHLNNNNINTLTDETFCKGNTSRYIRSTMEEVRLDGNPLVLAEHPNSFICLLNYPTG
ncbi:hypothetical protein NHX12_012498 [Muraenolepis orangiensis]|uniref:Mimecan n=1 Tax=Muraenolepis orangiensis TaxID=630683 RepID=A0A9Q0DG89_9TELE|nr:hypothetical protein NHX12_012498 [Muraenolepis orangiensis]